jgi:hypothetical protein
VSVPGSDQEETRANHGHFHGEMREQYELGAMPLVLGRWDFCRLEFPLPEVWDGVDDDPWYAPTKVHQLEERC